MPNHVQNVLTFSSRESLEKVMNALKPGWKEEDGFRFEWIVPFPKIKEDGDLDGDYKLCDLVNWLLY